MLTSSLATNVVSPIPARLLGPHTGFVPPLHRHNGVGIRRPEPADRTPLGVASRSSAGHPTVESSPADIVKRRTVVLTGMTVEIIQATRRETIE